MDVAQYLGELEQVDPIDIPNKVSEDDIRHMEIVRLHILFMLVGLVLCLFMVLL